MLFLFFLVLVTILTRMTSFSPPILQHATSLSILKQLNIKDRTIILASGSPRRKELLSLMGISEFTVLKSDFAEDLSKVYIPLNLLIPPLTLSNQPHPKDLFTSSDAYCLATAQAKASDVVKKLELQQGHQRVGTVLIGADTIVELNNKILEKPSNEVEAANMIRELSGAWHTVHTGVCIFTNQGQGTKPLENTAPLINTSSFVTSTRVKFLSLSEEDIAAYVETKDGFDKAGGYGIQSIGGQMVEKIDGCYFNVMGLPISALSASLMKLYAAGQL